MRVLALRPARPPTYGQLQELHGKAKRKALGTDQQLEELLAELERV